MVLIGVMAALSAPHISFGNNPLLDRTNRIASVFKLVRTKAVAQTSAYRISQDNVKRLKVERANNSNSSPSSCFEINDNDKWEPDRSFTDEDLSLTEAEDVKGMAKNADIQFVNVTLTNPNGTTATPWTSWKICYDSRGITNASLLLFIKDVKTNKQKKIEIFAAGGAEVYDNP